MIKSKGTVFLILLSIIGCKEVVPVIETTEKALTLRDTTYITIPVPESDYTTIYIEDLTAVRMYNCPKTADEIKEIRAANGSNVVSVGIYPSTLGGLTDPYPGFDTMNTDEANQIFTNIYNSPGALPAGGINRKIFNGETSFNILYNKWSIYADSIKLRKSPAIISSQLLNYNNSTRKARVRVKVLFTQKYIGELNLTVYLTESKIISKQLMPNIVWENDSYEHNHVLRKSVTPFNGDPLEFSSGKTGIYEAGQTYEKDFEVDLKPKWVKKNCSFVILVNCFKTNDKEVIQASELNLN